MAEKRMFSSQILNNDDFIDMPTEAQMLYIRLNMAADDRGICDSPRTVMRSCSASNDSMNLLIAKKFVLLPSCKPSVVVIKHWWVHNSIRKERFKETKHTDVMSELFYDDNKSYSQNPNDGHISCLLNGKLIWPPDLPEIFSGMPPSLPQPSPSCTPTVHQSGDSWVPQNRIDKNREEENSGIYTRTREEEDDGFEAFWSAYPVKSGDIRQAYFEYLGALKTGATVDAIMAAVEWQSREKDTRYMPSAEKWLRNKGWSEPKPKPKTGGRQKRVTTFMDIGAAEREARQNDI